MKPLSELDSGYRSGPSDWVRFLDCWDQELADNSARQDQPYQSVWRQARVQAAASREATEQALAEAEKRLQLKLPRSYRDFILASNGSFLFGLNQYELAFGVRSSFVSPASLDFFKHAKPDEWRMSRRPDDRIGRPELTTVSDANYYRYGHSYSPNGMADPVQIRNAYFDDVLYLGFFFDQAELMLNPKERTRDGEWEAWELNSKAAGVIRYRSFAEMIQNLYFQDADVRPVVDPVPPHLLRNSCARLISSAGLNDTLDPEQRWQAVSANLRDAERFGHPYAIGHVLREVLTLEDPRGPPLVLSYAQSTNEEIANAAIFALGEWKVSQAVSVLLKLMRQPGKANFAAITLSKILGPADTAQVPALLPLLHSSDVLTQISAVQALQAIGSRDAVTPLIELLQTGRPVVSYHAVVALGTLRDSRAVAPLLALRAKVDTMELPPPQWGGTRSTPPPADIFIGAIDLSVSKCHQAI